MVVPRPSRINGRQSCHANTLSNVWYFQLHNKSFAFTNNRERPDKSSDISASTRSVYRRYYRYFSADVTTLPRLKIRHTALTSTVFLDQSSSLRRRWRAARPVNKSLRRGPVKPRQWQRSASCATFTTCTISSRLYAWPTQVHMPLPEICEAFRWVYGHDGWFNVKANFYRFIDFILSKCTFLFVLIHI